MEYPLVPDVVQRCGVDYEMSTSGHGVIIPAERGNEIGDQSQLRHMDDRGDRFSEPMDCGTDAGGTV